MAGTIGSDRNKANARRRAWRARKHVEKYGPDAGDQRGKHGNHAKGQDHPKYNGHRFVTSHGYVAVRVPPDHPHAWGHSPTLKYAYEHILVAEESLGRTIVPGEVVHHRHENKQDNRDTELDVMTTTEHAREHDKRRGRDALGRFPPKRYEHGG